MVNARFYLLKSMELEMEVTKDWLVSTGKTEEELMLPMAECDTTILDRYRNTNQVVPLEVHNWFFRVKGKPAVAGSTIKGIVRKNLYSISHSGAVQACPL